MTENIQTTLTALCDTLRTTIPAGGPNGNPLIEIRYMVDGNEEYAVPIFEDGTGEPNEHCPHGYYGVNISGDSAYGALIDVFKNFCQTMW